MKPVEISIWAAVDRRDVSQQNEADQEDREHRERSHSDRVMPLYVKQRPPGVKAHENRPGVYDYNHELMNIWNLRSPWNPRR